MTYPESYKPRRGGKPRRTEWQKVNPKPPLGPAPEPERSRARQTGRRDCPREEHARCAVSDDRIKQAVEMATRYGGIDGAHHKAWVIDQMVRILTGDEYERVIAEACTGDDGPETYAWDEGAAP